jgi:thiol:disulfide interchange protein DsbC
MNRFLSACVLAAFLALFLSPPAAAFRKEAGNTKDCSECHKLTKEEAGKTLGRIADNVVGVVQGPFPGIWEVDVARDGKTYPIYLDYSLKYLFTGQFIGLPAWRTHRSPVPGLNLVDVPPFRSTTPSGWEPVGKKTVIVLSDLTCPSVKLHGRSRRRRRMRAWRSRRPIPEPNDKATGNARPSCAKRRKCHDAFAGKGIALQDGRGG